MKAIFKAGKMKLSTFIAQPFFSVLSAGILENIEKIGK